MTRTRSTVTHVAGLICYPCPRPPRPGTKDQAPRTTRVGAHDTKTKSALAGILADVLEHLATGDPLRRRRFRNGPAARPWPVVDGGIVDGHFVRQRFQCRPGDALRHVELLARRVGAGNPLLLVEADRIDAERVAVPTPDGMSEIG